MERVDLGTLSIDLHTVMIEAEYSEFALDFDDVDPRGDPVQRTFEASVLPV